MRTIIIAAIIAAATAIATGSGDLVVTTAISGERGHAGAHYLGVAYDQFRFEGELAYEYQRAHDNPYGVGLAHYTRVGYDDWNPDGPKHYISGVAYPDYGESPIEWLIDPAKRDLAIRTFEAELRDKAVRDRGVARFLINWESWPATEIGGGYISPARNPRAWATIREDAEEYLGQNGVSDRVVERLAQTASTAMLNDYVAAIRRVYPGVKVGTYQGHQPGADLDMVSPSAYCWHRVVERPSAPGEITEEAWAKQAAERFGPMRAIADAEGVPLVPFVRERYSFVPGSPLVSEADLRRMLEALRDYGVEEVILWGSYGEQDHQRVVDLVDWVVEVFLPVADEVFGDGNEP